MAAEKAAAVAATPAAAPAAASVPEQKKTLDPEYNKFSYFLNVFMVFPKLKNTAVVRQFSSDVLF